MRLRNIPGADEAISNSPYVIQNPTQMRGHWQDAFPKKQPIHIEIGMGKGQFLIEMARLHPDINYIGMERYTSVLLRATQKMELEELDNLVFVCYDAAEITDAFEFGELDRIYLNFSDPWPKDRHAKRRLTSHQFLDKYHQLLPTTCQLEFKTDNQDLFTFSLDEINESNDWQLIASTRDLHNEASMNQGNVMTEYEAKFSAMGNPICKLIAKPL